jgi:hypothetical protein
MRRLMVVIGFMCFIQSACSSCSGDNNNAHDAGPDTSADTDTDTDTDTDADTDTDSDTISDAGPWEWTDLPTGEDCGDGCEQLTYTDEVRFLEWDVWETKLVFKDGIYQSHVIDIANKKQLAIPSPYPELMFSDSDPLCSTHYPSIYEDIVVYSFAVFVPGEEKTQLIRTDLQSQTQQFLWTTDYDVSVFFEAQDEIDTFNNRAISQGGCDNSYVGELCFFPITTPGEVNVLTGSHYGGYNSLWGDIAVWFTIDYEGDTFDIEGYNFASSEFFYITHDAETQLDPRIQGSTVVYMDLRFGDSNLDGNWNHAAVFAYDLTTEATKQITSGAWIAAYPDVYENHVVWLDYRASSNPNDAQSFDGVEIWGYNLTTDTEFQITNLPGRPKQTPRIWGNKVFVDMMTTSGGNAIYMFDLPDGAK